MDINLICVWFCGECRDKLKAKFRAPCILSECFKRWFLKITHREISFYNFSLIYVLLCLRNKRLCIFSAFFQSLTLRLQDYPSLSHIVIYVPSVHGSKVTDMLRFLWACTEDAHAKLFFDDFWTGTGLSKAMARVVSPLVLSLEWPLPVNYAE